MSNTNEQQAFPLAYHLSQTILPGMTLRDYFAAKAIPALIENFALCLDRNGEGFDLNLVGNEGGTPDAIAEDAYAIADAMLRARDKK